MFNLFKNSKQDVNNKVDPVSQEPISDPRLSEAMHYMQTKNMPLDGYSMNNGVVSWEKDGLEYTMKNSKESYFPEVEVSKDGNLLKRNFASSNGGLGGHPNSYLSDSLDLKTPGSDELLEKINSEIATSAQNIKAQAQAQGYTAYNRPSMEAIGFADENKPVLKDMEAQTESPSASDLGPNIAPEKELSSENNPNYSRDFS